MSDKVSTIPRPPVMRRLLRSRIKMNIVGATVVSIASALAYKYMVAEPRKARYAEFYRNYDAEKEFEEMRKKGVFQSC